MLLSDRPLNDQDPSLDPNLLISEFLDGYY